MWFNFKTEVPSIRCIPKCNFWRVSGWIKCTINAKSRVNYLNSREDITLRCETQIQQLQMLLSGRKKGLFCFASPDFEKSKSITVVKVLFNPMLIRCHMKRALSFWEKSIGNSYYVTTDCILGYHNNHYTENAITMSYFIKLDCIFIKPHTRGIAWSARHTKR